MARVAVGTGDQTKQFTPSHSLDMKASHELGQNPHWEILNFEFYSRYFMVQAAAGLGGGSLEKGRDSNLGGSKLWERGCRTRLQAGSYLGQFGRLTQIWELP